MWEAEACRGEMGFGLLRIDSEERRRVGGMCGGISPSRDVEMLSELSFGSVA
jgi:hypothetical protein